MTQESRTDWTCDRCGHEATTHDERGPLDWSFLVIGPFPQGPAASGSTRLDLCRGCAEGVLVEIANHHRVPARG